MSERDVPANAAPESCICCGKEAGGQIFDSLPLVKLPDAPDRECSGVGGVEPLTEEECDRLEEIFNLGAAKVEVLDAYWIHGMDTGEDYCRECALLEITKEKARRHRLPKAKKKDTDGPSLDGGWCTEHDSSPFCATCGKRLEGTLTDYGCRQELDHFLEYGFDPSSNDDCYSMADVISSRGWRPWTERTYMRDYEREEDERYFADLWTLGRRILGGGGAEQVGDGNASTRSGAGSQNVCMSH